MHIQNVPSCQEETSGKRASQNVGVRLLDKVLSVALLSPRPYQRWDQGSLYRVCQNRRPRTQEGPTVRNKRPVGGSYRARGSNAGRELRERLHQFRQGVG